MEDIAEKFIHFISSSKPYAQVGMGAASGWLIGFLIMKIGKFAVAAVGGAVILLKMAEIEGLVKIEWSKITQNVHNISMKPITNLTYGDVDEIPSTVQNFVISFFGGSLIGIGCS